MVLAARIIFGKHDRQHAASQVSERLLPTEFIEAHVTRRRPQQSDREATILVQRHATAIFQPDELSYRETPGVRLIGALRPKVAKRADPNYVTAALQFQGAQPRFLMVESVTPPGSLIPTRSTSVQPRQPTVGDDEQTLRAVVRLLAPPPAKTLLTSLATKIHWHPNGLHQYTSKPAVTSAFCSPERTSCCFASPGVAKRRR